MATQHHHQPVSAPAGAAPLSTQQQHQSQQEQPQQQTKLTTSFWEDEGTICYQVDAKGVCVARRQDNDMVNGTKLLNVVGMSRGKRDGILKNERGRVVVKVGAMHLKGVWITISRAKALAAQYNIADLLHPLFADDPAIFFYAAPPPPPPMLSMPPGYYYPHAQFGPPPPPPPYLRQQHHHHHHPHPANGKLNFYL
ncbi:transcription regulator HTH, apses-type DNA-binding domain-containing protein [Circinella umbellata]|nr:transcription regulator HTH, apses-type DNA-binding domain-containing protein [Circinella umbellata]